MINNLDSIATSKKDSIEIFWSQNASCWILYHHQSVCALYRLIYHQSFCALYLIERITTFWIAAKLFLYIGTSIKPDRYPSISDSITLKTPLYIHVMFVVKGGSLKPYPFGAYDIIEIWYD